MSFERYVCWFADRVHHVLNPDAEHIDDDVFLATHHDQPIRLVDPLQSNFQWTRTSQEFLSDFLSRSQTRALAIVLGESGSGKSHFIHWLNLNIPLSGDRVVVAIPRTGTNLRGVLERIITVLPMANQGKYRERLDQSPYQSQDPIQRKERLLSEIALAIGDSVIPDEPHNGEIEKWLIENLPNVFNDPHIRNWFTNRTDGIIDDLTSHIADDRRQYRRATRRRAFERGDLPLSGVETTQASRVVADFLGALMGSSDDIDLALNIINRSLDVAIGRVLNFTGDQLVDLMADVRNSLRKQGKELVLLIEDLARLQGIDQALLDGLLLGSGDDADNYCVLRCAIAVTTGYYERLPQTFQTRVNLVVEMNPIVSGGPSITKSDVVTFAAGYLNTVRSTKFDLHTWFKQRDGEGGEIPPPNRCTLCEFQRECHAAFGHVDGVGLYPFSQSAILNLATYKGALADKFNPRRLIKDVMAEVLDNHRTELAEGRFPSRVLRDKMVPRGRGLPPVVVSQLVEADRAYGERQRAVLEIWGELDRVVDLPDGLYQAFGMPKPNLRGSQPQPPRPDEKGTEEKKPPPIPDTIKDIRSWANGSRLTERVVNLFRPLLYAALIEAIDWDSEGWERARFASSTGTTPFRQRFIEFRNQEIQPGPATVHLVIPLTETADDLTRSARALEALWQYRENGHWDFEDGDEAFVTFAECLRDWSGALIKQLRALPCGSQTWDPVPAAVELLVVGAALAGVPAIADESVSTATGALFASWPDEAPAMSNEWKQLYRLILAKRAMLVGLIRQWSSGTKGGQAGSFVDASQIVPHIDDLRRRWTLLARPPDGSTERPEPYATLATLHSSVQKQLSNAALAEFNVFARWRKQLHNELPIGMTPRQVVKSLGEFRDAAAGAGLSVSPDLVHRFNSALADFALVDVSTSLYRVGEDATNPVRFTPRLVRQSTKQAWTASRELFDVTALFLTRIDTSVERELELKRMSNDFDIEKVQKRIRTSLTDLIILLERLELRHVNDPG